MNTLPPPLRIANAAAVLDGPYGASHDKPLSRQLRVSRFTATPPVSCRPWTYPTPPTTSALVPGQRASPRRQGPTPQTTPARHRPRRRPTSLLRRHGAGRRRQLARGSTVVVALPQATHAQRGDVGTLEPSRVALYHRGNDKAYSPYAITPNVPLQNTMLPISVPGLDRSRLPTFLYMWQPDPTLEKLSGR
jgi:hypothetical protein